ncbi:MAG: hypothetical protein ACI835_003192 [Planctomycetota bacterium]|jgi:hypothetical protein
MNIDLLPNEEVLRTIEGKRFELNPIMRMLSSLKRVIGVYSSVVVTLTSQRCVVEEQDKVLWSVPTSRALTVVSLEDISSIIGLKTSFMMIFKSYNMVVQSGGSPLAGVNLKRMTSSKMDAEINGFSILKQSRMGLAS